MSEPTSLLEILPQLKGASLACLYALCLVSDPVTTAWLAKVTGCSLLTTRRGLLQLSRLWLARSVDSGERWELSPGVLVRLPQFEWGGEFALAASSPEFESVKSLNSLVESESRTQTQTVLKDSLDFLTDSDSALKVDDVDVVDFAEGLDVERILAATELLFGERVLGTARSFPNPARLLGVIAEVYDHRQLLRKPARVAYTNVYRRTEPRRQYMQDPLAYLPQNFLVAAGLAPPEDEPELRDDAPSPEVTLPLPDVDPQALQAWQTACRLLQEEIPKSAYLDYLAEAQLSAYQADPDPATFSVMVASPSQKDWLEAHLRRKLEQHLSGITAHPAQAVFLVRQPLGAGSA